MGVPRTNDSRSVYWTRPLIMTARTITTSATAQRTETPDLATVEVTAVGEGNSVAAARTTARDRTTTIRESVTAVSADQIRIVDLQIELLMQ